MKPKTLKPRLNPLAVRHFLTLQDANASGAAIEASMQWIEASEERRADIQALGDAWFLCDELREEYRCQLAEPEEKGRQAGRHFRLGGALYALAASLILCMIGGIYLLQRGNPAPATIAGSTPLSYATAINELRTIALPDGSMVTLGGASEIRVNFESHRRQVALTSGQAFFSVAKDPARPFIVESGRGMVEAVGTQFDVHRSPYGATVTVIEGAVKVGARSTGGLSLVNLRAGMRLSYDVAGRLSPVDLIDLHQALQWRDGVFTYIDRPLAEVVADLNRYSAKPVILEGETATIRVTGRVHVDAIREWLLGMASATGVRIVETDNEIILRGGDAPREAAPAPTIS